MREYRRQLGDYLEFGVGEFHELRILYQRGEEYYESDAVIAGDEQEKQAIEHLDWAGIRRARVDNYRYLLELIAGISHVQPVYPYLPDDIQPMGLPVYIDGGYRDQLFDDLGHEGIGLTIHWDGLLRDPLTANLPGVTEIASRILTLPIDQRISHKQMDYMVKNLTANIIRAR